MSYNPFKRLLDLIPSPPLQIGEVVAYSDGVATIELPGGGISLARGDTTIGAKVYFRDAIIEGPAPDLPVEIIEL